MKNTFKFLGIIALVVMMGFSMTACDTSDSDGDDNTTLNVPKVSDLPAFPENSNPAQTAAQVDAILEDIKQSGIMEEFREEINNVVHESVAEKDEYGDYIWPDEHNIKDMVGNNVIVSSSGKTGEKYSNNAEKLMIMDYKDMKEILAMNLTTKDYSRGFDDYVTKGKATKDIRYRNVTIANGSTFEIKERENYEMLVTKGGTVLEAKVKLTEVDEIQYAGGFTVTTSNGSVKIVLDITATWNATANNVSIMDLFDNEDYYSLYNENEKYSGFLKVYGKDNALLKEVKVTNEETFGDAAELVGIHWYGEEDDNSYDDAYYSKIPPSRQARNARSVK